jgi:hypothetical protein
VLPVRTPRSAPGSGGTLAAIGRLWSEFTDPGPGGDAAAFIKNHGDGIGPGCMGIPFLTIGIVLIVVFSRRLDLADKRSFLPLLFGAVFGLAGLLVTTLGIKAILRKSGAPVARSGSPWTSDNDWDATGAVPDNPTGGFATAVGRLVLFVFVGFMNVLWTVKMTGGARVIVSLVVGLFDLLTLVVLYDTVRKMVQAVRVGTPRLAWRTFPFFTGGRFEAVFQTSRPMRPNGPAKVTLRRIEQRSGGDPGAGRTNGAQSFEVWSSEETLAAFAEGTMTSFPIAVAVPADQPGTDLSKNDCTYWQVLITVPVAGPDVEAVFLVPIYSRPA